MRIGVKGRNFQVDDDLRERIERKAGKIARQVSPLAELEVELREERNPSMGATHGGGAPRTRKGGPPRAGGHPQAQGPRIAG